MRPPEFLATLALANSLSSFGKERSGVSHGWDVVPSVPPLLGFVLTLGHLDPWLPTTPTLMVTSYPCPYDCLPPLPLCLLPISTCLPFFSLLATSALAFSPPDLSKGLFAAQAIHHGFPGQVRGRNRKAAQKDLLWPRPSQTAAGAGEQLG